MFARSSEVLFEYLVVIALLDCFFTRAVKNAEKMFHLHKFPEGNFGKAYASTKGKVSCGYFSGLSSF